MRKIGRNWETPADAVEFEAIKARVLFEDPRVKVREGMERGVALADAADLELAACGDPVVPAGLSAVAKVAWLSRAAALLGMDVDFGDVVVRHREGFREARGLRVAWRD